jgi:hypothetical protein
VKCCLFVATGKGSRPRFLVVISSGAPAARPPRSALRAPLSPALLLLVSYYGDRFQNALPPIPLPV